MSLRVPVSNRLSMRQQCVLAAKRTSNSINCQSREGIILLHLVLVQPHLEFYVQVLGHTTEEGCEGP